MNSAFGINGILCRCKTRLLYVANKASLRCKQGFFTLQTRLLCTANKASFHSKQGLFVNRADFPLILSGFSLFL